MKALMIHLTCSLSLAALLTAVSEPAVASKVIQNSVQGTVQSADSKQITINGVSYPLTDYLSKMPNATNSLVGKKVQIYLTSPAGSATARVFGITPASTVSAKQ